MFDAIARVLAFFYSLPVVGGNYGVAIILLTLAVMVILMPLTLRATRSTIKMQQVQPKLKELQKKHKDDRQQLNQEMMALYQSEGINPIGGCLPMIAQLPVFLVLFNVLRGLSRRVEDTAYYTIAEQARAQAGGGSIDGATFDPQYLSTDSQMYVDLAGETEMRFGPFDLAAEALDVLQTDFLRSIPYVLLIGFVVVTSFYQQHQVSARRTGGTGMNPQQEMILKFLPLLTGIWSFVFPAGLVVYWATSNVFRIGQQAYITRAFYGDGEGDDAGSGDDSGSSDDDPGPVDDAPSNGSNGSASKSDGNKKRSNGRSPKASDDNGDESDDDSSTNGSSTGDDREAAWARRRQEKAKVRSAARKKTETPSSRVTPKGTQPSQRKKRKR
ncbi:MAG: YidC/Oxa1 family membrane protein insertase [Actinomycetota bacterium]